MTSPHGLIFVYVTVEWQQTSGSVLSVSSVEPLAGGPAVVGDLLPAAAGLFVRRLK